MMKYDYNEEVAKERASVILRLKAEGKTLAEIGELFDLSRERVRQLLRRHFPDYPRNRSGRKAK